MGFKGLLEKMKLVEVDEPSPLPPSETPRPNPAPRRVTPAAPSPSINELIQKTPAPKLDEKVAATDEIPDFPSIYKASGVKDPAHGFTAFKVLEILSSQDFESLDAKAKAAALAGFLRMNPSGPVAIADVVQDALARDGALDNFETFLKSKLDAKRAEKDKQNAALQAEIDELTRKNREKIQANLDAAAREQERFAEWQARKRIEERRLFDAVSPFVERNPVSVGASETPAAESQG